MPADAPSRAVDAIKPCPPIPEGYTSWLDWGLAQWPWGWAVTLETAKLGNEAVNAERRVIRDAAAAELAELRTWKAGGAELVVAVMDCARELVKCADEQAFCGAAAQIDTLRQLVAEHDERTKGQ